MSKASVVKEVNEREIMTVVDLAVYLQLHQQTIYKMVKKKKIPCYRVGCHLRFKKEDVDAWLDKRANK